MVAPNSPPGGGFDWTQLAVLLPTAGCLRYYCLPAGWSGPDAVSVSSVGWGI